MMLAAPSCEMISRTAAYQPPFASDVAISSSSSGDRRIVRHLLCNVLRNCEGELEVAIGAYRPVSGVRSRLARMETQNRTTGVNMSAWNRIVRLRILPSTSVRFAA
jgi:hypothetical protein